MDSKTNEILQKFSAQKLELSDSVPKLLDYHIGVESFGKNIDIDIKEISEIIEKAKSLKNTLKVDLEYLLEDMKKLAKGIESAEVAAKLIGIKPNEIPNYSKALEAIKYGFKQEAKAKKILKQ